MRCIALTILLLISSASAADLPAIEWDAKTLRLIEPRGDYGRMVRLKDNCVACIFDRDGKMWIRRSNDDGATFGDAVLVAEDKDCWLTNADLLALRNGELVYFWNERPLAAVRDNDTPAPHGALTRPFLIRMARSVDLGRTWAPPQTIYTAGTSFKDGCWEPSAVELADGELQLFFANESPYRHSAEQEISLLRWREGAATWSEAKRASFRAGHRDGMPAPLVLPSGNVVFAIEDNGQEGGGDRFKISIVDSASGERWPALRDPLPPQVYAGAPCLRQLGDDATVLSFQESDDGLLEHCRLAVCVGNASARNFANKTYPLPKPARGNQAWNSMFIKNAKTITAISTATIDRKRGIWLIDGRVLKD
jgi:hypothetical protein